MTVETANFIADLQPTLPAPGDPKSQGDNHIRLLKQVLQNTFPGANKAFGGASLVGQNANFSITSGQSGTTFAVGTTSAPVMATLPALAGADAGWSCTFVKSTGDVNPLFIINPAAQNMLSGDTIVTKCRRAIFGHTFKALWTGSFWVVDRILKVPVGTILDCPRGVLPPGYEFANGQVLVAANYPEYVYAMGSGVTSDRRGFVAAGRDDTGTRLTAPWINGNILGSVGGGQSSQLVTANLPAYTPSGTVSGSVSISGGTRGGDADSGGTNFGPGGGPTVPIHSQAISVAASGLTFSGNAQGGVSQTFNNLPPMVITNMIVVVE